MSLITAERLLRLAYKYPSLQNSWFLIACACLSVINQPHDIPKIYHFALRQQLLEFKNDPGLMTDKYLLKLASDSIASSEKYEELSSIGIGLPDVLIPYTYHDKLPLNYKFNKGSNIFEYQNLITVKFREVLLKMSGLIGVPKTINGLNYLKTVTPMSIKNNNSLPLRPPLVKNNNIPSSKIIEEDVAGTRFESDDVIDTIDGPINPNSINSSQVFNNLKAGSNLWNKIYSNNYNKKIRNQIYQSYPDLWYFIYQNIYSNIFSFTEILNEQETALVIVTSLIPQDVNPQLKGHLRGALNLGVSHEQLNDLRLLVFDICDWAGGNFWKEGKDSVAKL